MTPQPKRKLLIVTYHRLDLWIAPAWFAERLRGEFPELEVVQLNSYENVGQEIADAEIMFGISLRPERFLAARNLRWIHSQAAAVHQFLFPELVNSDVILTNARDVHGPVVAEQVIAMMFALARQIPAAVRYQQKHVWGQEAMWRASSRPRELAGATVGLVGLGSIGRNVAKRASFLGMRVIAVREHPEKEKPQYVDEVLPSSKLSDLLARSDYVVLSTPVTPETTGMIGGQQLAAMKPDACMINVGRGPLIDETALIEALREHKIGGAALDVFDEEPLPSASPLWDFENLLITPHTAGMSDKMWERHYALFSENLRRYFSGQPLAGLVDKRSGY
ncbi:MAG: D-isomer specific 2-hydroxyacid dehydrogenase, NAD-binding protein [Acidobacteriaceae bacterium]|nr:D-isomer specific 2-hydroxyacid dehydrogenase, NAD-binding protein [Acidobacteriaceae bacterium]